MREKLIHELEEERRLRLDSEKRLREVTEESELGRVQMVSLQQHFSRMEETVRTLLQNQGVLEQTAVDTVDIMKAYKEKLSEEVQKHRASLEESASLPEKKTEPLADGASEVEDYRDRTRLLLERLRTLEEENCALALEKESQREQYERCLDEVANQVVQALLTQKDLREECLKLRTRVFDLEQQNRTLSVLFQQRVRPASDLLLQKLHSRIMHLSAADLLLEPERSKSFLLSRTDSPPHDVQPLGKAGFPVSKCVSQLSLTAPMLAYQRSSCSSSELSLSSACSEYSSGSFTWNDGRSCGKMSSLTWEKRLSLGSSAPSNICAPLEEQLPTRRKESHILEGLRKLQRRKPKASSSSRVSKSGYKDCMNSNEGIYSLGIKSGSKGISKPYAARATSSSCVKRFTYDSDDADDESPHSTGCRGDRVPIKEGWMYCKRLSHSVSDSLCSWEGLQDVEPTAGSASTNQPPPYNCKDRPEKLMSFLNSFLSSGRTPAVLSPSLLHMEVSPTEPDFPLHLSDTEPEDPNSETGAPTRPTPGSVLPTAQQPEKSVKRPSRPAATTLLPGQCLRREQGRTQSADGRPRPFSLIKAHKGPGVKSQSEESIVAVLDEDCEPVELRAPPLPAKQGSRTELGGSKARAGYSESASQERPVKQKGANSRNYTVLESPEKPSESQNRAIGGGGSREGSTERPPPTQPTPPRKLIKPPGSRANKVQAVAPVTDTSVPKTNGSKIPGRGKESPQKGPKGSVAAATSGPATQEKSPSSPPVKMSRFIKTPCTQSPKAVGSKLPGRGEWGKSSCVTSPGSPHSPRRILEHVDYGEQPTRDRHYETSSKIDLRSPSPPPPPGRTTSLLIRPNYDGSSQALKTGAQPSAPATVRGPPPSYHPPPVPNMQHTLSYKGQDSVDLDAGYGTAIAPQKLVDKTIQHLQKSPSLPQTASKGTSTRTPPKHYLPTSASGQGPEHPESTAKNSKNVPPYPYSTQKGSTLHSTLASKKALASENNYPPLSKTSSSLPVSPQSALPCPTEVQESLTQPPQPVLSPTNPQVGTPNQTEKASKTRIPMGFKAFVKSSASHKQCTTTPGKQEKDHINSVSKEIVTSNTATQCLPPPAYGIEPSPMTSVTETKSSGRSGGQEAEAALAGESELVCDKPDRDGRIFLRQISVPAKPHLKPALGMNGAKARSQSFSTNYIEKPGVNAVDGPGKIRTQIITNSGERGNSLTRQSSFVEGLQAKAAPVESPVRCPSNRLSYYGGMTTSNCQQVLLDRTPKFGSKAEVTRSGGGKAESTTTPPQKEARSLPLADRIGLRSSKKPAKAPPPPQFECPSSPVYTSSEGPVPGGGGKALSPGKSQVACSGSTGGAEEDDKLASPTTACSIIEEKVMMGIQENMQKGQAQEKSPLPEGKQKTGPSLANWFGLRKSKLPALNGNKKSDSQKGKEEKKEVKLGSVLGGKQNKPDKKKKNDSPSKESQDQTLTCDSGNKLSSIMDHCNIQMGQIANQIQCSTVYIGKDQFMKDILGRRVVVKGDSLAASLPGVGVPQKHSGEMRTDMEIGTDKATIIVTQNINIRSSNEEDPIPESSCQDHMIGSSCQMRTLDSGIGTFPLPDSVARVNGRHLPKSDSRPKSVAGTPTEPDEGLPARSPLPYVKVPLPALEPCHPHAPGTSGPSLSDPTVTSGGRIKEVQSRLPKPSTSDAIRTRRLSQMELRSGTDHAVTSPTLLQDKQTENKRRVAKEPSSPSDRALRVCAYSGSSSETETEADSEGSTLGSPHKTLLHPSHTGHSEREEPSKRSSMVKSLTIMDCYPHDVFSHLEKDPLRSVSQYNLLLNESGTDVKAGDRISKGKQLVKSTVSGSAELQPGSLEVSLESLNKLNLSSSSGLFPRTELGGGGGVLRSGGGEGGDGHRPNEPASSSSFSGKAGPDHVGGSLSDSLYDSFSSCTSQGSNDG